MFSSCVSCAFCASFWISLAGLRQQLVLVLLVLLVPVLLLVLLVLLLLQTRQHCRHCDALASFHSVFPSSSFCFSCASVPLCLPWALCRRHPAQRPLPSPCPPLLTPPLLPTH